LQATSGSEDYNTFTVQTTSIGTPIGVHDIYIQAIDTRQTSTTLGDGPVATVDWFDVTTAPPPLQGVRPSHPAAGQQHESNLVLADPPFAPSGSTRIGLAGPARQSAWSSALIGDSDADRTHDGQSAASQLSDLL